MRISDCSSDVCSSDLVAARQAAVAAIAEGGFGARELVVRTNGLDTPWGADDLAAVAGAGPAAILVPKVDRSEEHTSELQSLMRNSYAVFCLKKKKHKTTHS